MFKKKLLTMGREYQNKCIKTFQCFHYSPFGLRKKVSQVLRQRQLQKRMQKTVHSNKRLVLLILSGLYHHVHIESKNDVSLYLSVVCFSDCPQPKERDLLHTANTWHQCSGEKGDQLSVRISLEKKGTKSFPAEHCSLFSKSETNSNTMRPNNLRNRIFMTYCFKFSILVSLNKHFIINVPLNRFLKFKRYFNLLLWTFLILTTVIFSSYSKKNFNH